MKSKAILLFIVVLALVAKCQEPPTTASIDEKRDFMLGLINDVRNKTNPELDALYIVEDLNKIAQAHSVDMVVRKFFGHRNPSGQGAQARAYAAGFEYPVGENVAYASTLTNAHQALMSSSEHYKNTINPDWTRVGIGMYTSENGNIYVTILFSMRDIALFPLTDQEMKPVVDQLDSFIFAKNPLIKTKIDTLSTHIKNWIIAGMVPTSYQEYLRSQGYPVVKMRFGINRAPWLSNVVSQLTFGRNFIAPVTTPPLTSYGLGVNVGVDGTATVVVVFSV